MSESASAFKIDLTMYIYISLPSSYIFSQNTFIVVRYYNIHGSQCDQNDWFPLSIDGSVELNWKPTPREDGNFYRCEYGTTVPTEIGRWLNGGWSKWHSNAAAINRLFIRLRVSPFAMRSELYTSKMGVLLDPKWMKSMKRERGETTNKDDNNKYIPEV